MRIRICVAETSTGQIELPDISGGGPPHISGQHKRKAQHEELPGEYKSQGRHLLDIFGKCLLDISGNSRFLRIASISDAPTSSNT